MDMFPTIKNKEVILTKAYKLAVNVEINKQHYAGILELSPEKITLKIMGDEKENRMMPHEHDDDYDSLICKFLAAPIILQSLKHISSFFMSIGDEPPFSNYSEKVFNVDSIIYYPTNPISTENKFSGLNIYSKTINDWIGETTTQDALINKYSEAEGNVFKHCPELLYEFNFGIDDLGSIGVFYKIYPQLESLKAGIEITPYLFLRFKSEKTEKEVTEKFHQLYNLLALMIGNDFTLEKIEFICEDFNFRGISSQFPMLYYPSITKEIARQINRGTTPLSYLLFPLGKNLRYDNWGLPEMPQEIFSNYFSLDLSELSHYGKYVKYRRMENVEERFLGYFRILEKLKVPKNRKKILMLPLIFRNF
jgi:hypothetical protein